MRFLQHLLAELEQLGSGTRKAAASATTAAATSATTTTPTATTALKGVQPSVEPSSQPKLSQSRSRGHQAPRRTVNGSAPTGDAEWKAVHVCSFLAGPQSRGALLAVRIQAASGQRLRNPRTIFSGAPTSSSTPPRPTVAAATSSTTTNSAIASSPAKGGPTSSASTTTSGGAAANNNKIDAAKMTEILNETNRMLKAFTAQAEGEAPTAPPPMDPLAMIQQQLDEVRRLKAIKVTTPGNLSSADSSSFCTAVDWCERG